MSEYGTSGGLPITEEVIAAAAAEAERGYDPRLLHRRAADMDAGAGQVRELFEPGDDIAAVLAAEAEEARQRSDAEERGDVDPMPGQRPR